MSSKEVRNKEVYSERVKRLTKKAVVATSFQSTSPEDWGLPNGNNHCYKMTTLEQWNYGDGQRGIMPIIKKGIISYERASRLSFDYAFAHHAQIRLLCNNILTKTIYFFRELDMVVGDLYHNLCLKCFGSKRPSKEARATCWNIATTLLVCLFDELRAVRVVSEDLFNHPDRANEL